MNSVEHVESAVQDARIADQARRQEAGTAIVHIESLMKNLVRYMPRYETESETARYLEAVKDIAIQVGAVTFQHDSTTGELHEGGPRMAIDPTTVVDDAIERAGRG